MRERNVRMNVWMNVGLPLQLELEPKACVPTHPAPLTSFPLFVGVFHIPWIPDVSVYKA